MFDLQPPRHISTLHYSDATRCPLSLAELMRARMSAIGDAPCREGADFDPLPSYARWDLCSAPCHTVPPFRLPPFRVLMVKIENQARSGHSDAKT
jgi:hypothetical protein